MNKIEREKSFYNFLEAKLELLDHFVIRPGNRLNTILFKEEFTFDNWLKGNIGRRLYSTSYKPNKPIILGKEYIAEPLNEVMCGFEYSIYRFVNYNFKMKTYKYKQ